MRTFGSEYTENTLATMASERGRRGSSEPTDGTRRSAPDPSYRMRCDSNEMYITLN